MSNSLCLRVDSEQTFKESRHESSLGLTIAVYFESTPFLNIMMCLSHTWAWVGKLISYVYIYIDYGGLLWHRENAVRDYSLQVQPLDFILSSDRSSKQKSR